MNWTHESLFIMNHRRNELIYILTVLSLIMFTKHCQSDIALKYFKTHNKNILNNPHKIWHSYTEIMLFKFINIKVSTLKYSKFIMYQLMKYSISFVQKNNEFLGYMSLNDESVQQINITKPITKMDMSVVFSSQKAILLYFHTDSKLVLNITFFDLHFYAGLENCILEKLSVINLKTEKTSYEYCGHVPTFNLYPEFNDVMM